MSVKHDAWAAHYWRDTRNRLTGTVISVIHGEDEGLDFETDGPWYTICNEHTEICSHATLAAARYHASVPDWCGACAKIINGKETTTT